MEARFDGLSEYISRRGRMKILDFLLKNSRAPVDIARELNVSRAAVHGWLKEEGRHPSNEHTLELLGLLEEEDGKELERILIGELEVFEELVFDRIDR